jgi:hypothetical protein
MATGVLFGVMAGVPTALLVMAASRRRNGEERAAENRQLEQQGQLMPLNRQMNGQINAWGMPYAQQPPIIVVAGPQGFGGGFQPAQSNPGWLPQDAPARHFTIVGEREELLEDW